MGFKDPEARKKYARDWARRKKAGLQTRITEKLTDVERKRRKKIWDKKASEVQKKKRAKWKSDALGKACVICKIKSGIKLCAHRKDGQSHYDFNMFTNEEYKKAMESGKFVLLCYICHKSVHWCMKYLGMDWKQIMDKRK